MSKKFILYVEDNDTQRQALHYALVLRGFAVESVGTVAQARAALKERGQSYDVVVLDMKLEEDPDHNGVTGAKLGIEFVQRRPCQLPELIILTAFRDMGYYDSAIQLGAAAYLSKGQSKASAVQEEVIRYVRVLALKHAINLEQPLIQESLNNIAESSHSEFEALTKFCSQVLVPEFTSCLGAPFFLLLTGNESVSPQRQAITILCGGNADLPKGPDPAYATLQGLAHGDANRSEPFVFDEEKMPNPANPQTAELYAKLHGAALLPLSFSNKLRLAIGILPGGKDREDPRELARVMGDYFRPAAIECMMTLLTNSLANNLATRRKASLRRIAELCLYVGQDLSFQLQAGRGGGFFQTNCRPYRVLDAIAQDLQETGALLKNLNGETEPEAHTLQELPPQPVAMLIAEAWKDLREQQLVDGVEQRTEGDCAVQADKADLLLIIVRLLQWLALRQEISKRDQFSMIQVHCYQRSKVAEIVFEDASRRLAKPLRQRLFEPFSLATLPPVDNDRLAGPGLYLALYLAKMLVEEKYGGQLLDLTDELPGTSGHRFVIQLPAATNPIPVNA